MSNDVNTDAPMSFDEMSKARVQLSYQRLGKLMALNAPSAIIAKETAMLLDRLAVRYGIAAWSAIGEQAIARATVAMGFCPYHEGSDRPRLDARGSMCAACWNEDDETTARIDALFGKGDPE